MIRRHKWPSNPWIRVARAPRAQSFDKPFSSLHSRHTMLRQPKTNRARDLQPDLVHRGQGLLVGSLAAAALRLASPDPSEPRQHCPNMTSAQVAQPGISCKFWRPPNHISTSGLASCSLAIGGACSTRSRCHRRQAAAGGPSRCSPAGGSCGPSRRSRSASDFGL